MSSRRTYSGVVAQQRAIISLFSTLKANHPTTAEVVMIQLQRILRDPNIKAYDR